MLKININDLGDKMKHRIVSLNSIDTDDIDLDRVIVAPAPQEELEEYINC